MGNSAIMSIEFVEIFRFNDIDTLRELLDNGLDPDSTRCEIGIGINTSLLKLGVLFKRFDMIKLLLERGAHVNNLSYDDNKNVLYSILNLSGSQQVNQQINNDIIGLLISNGINYNNIDDFGDTVIDKAIIYGDLYTFEAIVDIVGIEKIKIRKDIFTEIIDLSYYNPIVQKQADNIVKILKVIMKYKSINYITKRNFKLAVSSGIFEFFIMFMNYGYFATLFEINILSNLILTDYIKCNFLENIINFYNDKKKKAERTTAKITLNYKNLPNEITENIMSFIY
jgi:hypothetical protein